MRKTKPGLFVDIKEREKRARELFDRLNVDIDVSKPVKNLSPAHQQLVEIAKAVSKQVKILIMDEPQRLYSQRGGDAVPHH